MNENLLYYPYINIPNNNWTFKSILYWDNVGIIIPENFRWKPENFEPYTVELLQSDLIEGLYVGQGIDELIGVEKVFFNLIEKPEFDVSERRNNFQKGNYRNIYRDKFTDFLFLKLLDLGIAKPMPNEPIFLVESETAKILMFYLATTLSFTKDYTPSTDSIDNLNLNLTITNAEKDTVKLNNIRQHLLDDLIPYPVNPNLTKLRHFKDKYYDELKSFRVLLEKYAYSISLLETEEFQESSIKLTIAEINDKRDKILRELENSKFGKISFGTALGLIATIGGIAVGDYIFGSLALASSIFNEIESYNRNSKSIKEKDFAYLALIDKKMK